MGASNIHIELCRSTIIIIIFLGKNMRNFIIMIIAISISFLVSAGVVSHNETWKSLINVKLGKSCIKEEPEVGNTIIGNNGYREEEWSIETCKGKKEYIVFYYPVNYFPKRSSEYEIKEKDET